VDEAGMIRFYGVLKILAEFGRDTSLAKFKDILSNSLLRY
jgi:hypothetical protein